MRTLPNIFCQRTQSWLLVCEVDRAPMGVSQWYLFEHKVAVLLRAAGEGKLAAKVRLDGEHRLFVLDLIPVVQSQSPDLLLQPLVLRHAEIVCVCGVTGEIRFFLPSWGLGSEGVS